MICMSMRHMKLKGIAQCVTLLTASLFSVTSAVSALPFEAAVAPFSQANLPLINVANFKNADRLVDQIQEPIRQIDAALSELEVKFQEKTPTADSIETLTRLELTYAQVKKMVHLQLTRAEWNKIKNENIKLVPMAKQLVKLYRSTFGHAPKIKLGQALKLIHHFDTAWRYYEIAGREL